MLSWLFSGMFQRFPNLKIALSEGEIGWIPYFLERAEQVLDKQRYWVSAGCRSWTTPPPTVDLDTFDVRATFRDHVFGCFIDDAHGIASLDEIGEDNVMCETDYPHSDSTWPNCIGVVQHLHRGTCPRRCSTRSCAATPSGCTASRRPSRRCWRMPDAGHDVGRSIVDRELCMGSGMCIVYAAGTFAHDDETKAVVIDPAGDPIEAIRTAVEACPTSALRARASTTRRG